MSGYVGTNFEWSISLNQHGYNKMAPCLALSMKNAKGFPQRHWPVTGSGLLNSFGQKPSIGTINEENYKYYYL